MYKLYLDKQEDFVCEVSVKNASLKGAISRLVIESAQGINLVFNGRIDSGKCIVPIRRLKNLLDENSIGSMFLEIIVEDTYFSPWKSDFIVEEHTSVKVKVDESKASRKPIIEVRVPHVERKTINEQKGINMFIPLHEISNLCNMFGITKSNINKKKEEFKQLLQEYFNANPEFISRKSKILIHIKDFIK